MDAGRLNRVANHPDVRPWLGGEGPVNWAPTLADSRNVALETGHGGWVFINLGDGRYEVHSQMLPEGRGDWEAARAALRVMFTATDCMEVVSKVPDGNAGAKGIARAMGFQELFRREACWRNPGGDIVGISYVGLTLDRWRGRDETLVAAGEWWHENLERAKAEAGSDLPTHPHDEAHERAVGASVLMFKAANPRKGVREYNRWALLAGYAPILLLSEHPVVVDARDAIVSLKGDDLEVLSCRGAQQEQR
jgi:hypothetical protein